MRRASPPATIDEDLALVAFLCWIRRVNAGRVANATEPRDALRAMGIAVKREPQGARRARGVVSSSAHQKNRREGGNPPGRRKIRIPDAEGPVS
jgi:hypothetical protein